MTKNNKVLTVYFYKNNNGKEPVREWLFLLNNNDRQTIGCNIKTIEFDWPIGMPLCKPLRNGLYEVRSNLEDGKISRVIFFIKDNKMILLNGFIKKTQQIPVKEIDLAIKRKNRYINEEK